VNDYSAGAGKLGKHGRSDGVRNVDSSRLPDICYVVDIYGKPCHIKPPLSDAFLKRYFANNAITVRDTKGNNLPAPALIARFYTKNHLATSFFDRTSQLVVRPHDRTAPWQLKPIATHLVTTEVCGRSGNPSRVEHCVNTVYSLMEHTEIGPAFVGKEVTDLVLQAISSGGDEACKYYRSYELRISTAFGLGCLRWSHLIS
jgi:hypothetical protein